jgi:hypothetical protein
MSNAKITPQFHYSIAKSVFDDIATNTGHYNYFLSNTVPWADIENVPEYDVSLGSDTDIRANMISTKKVTIGDVAFVVPDNQWESGVVFDMYDDLVDVSTKKFYCISDNKIYKCLNNNNGAPSTSQPNGTEEFPFDGGDGYIWKYMADIPAGFINKFAGSGMMPITRQIYNPYYSDPPGGTTYNILNENIKILDGGSGYNANDITLVIDGDNNQPGDVTATATAILDGSGSVTDITITNAGSGYTYANLTLVNNGTGSGAVFEIHVGNYANLDTNQAAVEAAAIDGSISTIVLANGGSGYSNGKTNNESNVHATITGDGTGAVVKLKVEDGVITECLITNYGSGYHYATISIQDTDNLSGTNITNASLRVILSPRGGHGYDLPRELKSTTLCLSNSLDSDYNHGIIVNNDYNQIGLIKGIEQYGVASRFFGAAGSTCYLVNTPSITSSVEINAILEMGTKTFRVISIDIIDGFKILLQPIKHNTDPVAGTVLKDAADQAALTVTSIIESPTINKHSGDIILAENRITFSVTGDLDSGNQGVKFKSFISF